MKRIILLDWWRLLVLGLCLAVGAWWLGASHLPWHDVLTLTGIVVFGLWTAPKTWTAVVVTVEDLNTHIRDNLLILKTSIDNLGHITWLIVSKAIDYTVTTSDDIVYVTVTKTMSLPAAPANGKPYRIKAYGAGVTVTVNVSGAAKTIDGAATFTLGPYDAAEFTYNGTEYSVH